jgi:hypothetical protein
LDGWVLAGASTVRLNPVRDELRGGRLVLDVEGAEGMRPRSSADEALMILAAFSRAARTAGERRCGSSGSCSERVEE